MGPPWGLSAQPEKDTIWLLVEIWLLFQVKGLFKPSSVIRERLVYNVMLVWRGPFNLRRVPPPSVSKLGLHLGKAQS